MRRLRAVAVVGLALAGFVAGCGDDGDAGTPSIVVVDAIVPEPAGANAALYMDLVNEGDGDDTLVGVRTDAAGAAELHRTESSEDGTFRMVGVGDLEVPAGSTVAFEPGGLHVMLLAVDDVTEGDTVEVELVFERSGTVVVVADVGDVGAGAGG